MDNGPAYQTVAHCVPFFDCKKFTGARSGRYVPLASWSPVGLISVLTHCGQLGLVICDMPPLRSKTVLYCRSIVLIGMLFCVTSGMSLSARPTSSMPAKPKYVCIAVSVCRWLWYQYVPGVIFLGMSYT